MINFLGYSPIVIVINYLALAMGLAALIMRGRALKVQIPGEHSIEILKNVLKTNNIWNLAALLWIFTGVILFGRKLDEGIDWYLANFWIRLNAGLFLGILIVELKPLISINIWRIGWLKNKGLKIKLGKSQIQSLVLFNTIEIVLVAVIPLVEFIKSLRLF